MIHTVPLDNGRKLTQALGLIKALKLYTESDIVNLIHRSLVRDDILNLIDDGTIDLNNLNRLLVGDCHAMVVTGTKLFIVYGDEKLLKPLLLLTHTHIPNNT